MVPSLHYEQNFHKFVSYLNQKGKVQKQLEENDETIISDDGSCVWWVAVLKRSWYVKSQMAYVVTHYNAVKEIFISPIYLNLSL